MTALNSPVSVDELQRRAHEHVAHQRWADAQIALEAIVQQRPHDVLVRMDLAAVILRQGRIRDVVRHLSEAVAHLPNNVPMILQLARNLSVNGEVLGARACLDHLERAPQPPAFVLAQQAEMRWTLGEISAARALMDKAVAKGIESRDEHYIYAMLLQFTGEVEKAEQVLLHTLKQWPDFGDAAAVLANLRKQTPENNHLDALRERLERLPAADADPNAKFARAEFEWAMFKVLDDLGRYEEAWPALERSSALMHELNPYDAEAEEALVARYMELATTIGAADAGRARSHDGPTPIFVVGMPRSGTTLIDRMLSSHSRVVSAGEIQDFQRQLFWMTDVSPLGASSMMTALERSRDIDFAELGARYLKQTQWRAQGRDFYVDKLPMNVRMVPLIRRALPHARILHMNRAPMDVCYSNFKAMFGNVSPYCYSQQSVAHYYKLYAKLTQHWRETLPGAMLDVSYAELVSDPNATFRKVLEHCELEVEEGCLRPERNTAPVATPSSSQVREPIHTRSLGEWQRYAAQLEPMRKLVEG